MGPRRQQFIRAADSSAARGAVAVAARLEPDL